MHKYRRVDTDAFGEAGEGEIRVTARGNCKAYVNHICEILKSSPEAQCTVMGMGSALPRAVTVSLVARTMIPDVHMVVRTGSETVVERHEPLEEGLDTVMHTRVVTVAHVLLSRAPLDADEVGYHPPLGDAAVPNWELLSSVEFHHNKQGSGKRGRGRGRGRGR